MKSVNCNIYFLLILAAVCSASCVNDALDGGVPLRPSDNMIRFVVSSGFSGDDIVSRSGEGSADAGDDLDPIVFSDGSDTLYLHRYVAPESERATGLSASAGTRAAEVNDVGGIDKFKVQATYADGAEEQFFPLSEAVPLSTDDNTNVWSIDDVTRYYWPATRKLRFNAFAPITAYELLERVKENEAEGDRIDLGAETITFSYTVPTSDRDEVNPRRDAEVQPDIMFASKTCSREEAEGGSYASLEFRHALSAIKFAVRDVANGEIVDISIKGVAGSGTCTFHPEAGPVNPESSTAFTWTTFGETAGYTQTFNYKTEDKYPSIPTLKDVTAINDEEDYKDMTFMLIPQVIPDEATLEITFRKKNADTDELEEPKILRGKLKTADIPLWEAGKEYIYTISTSSEVWEYVFEVKGNAAGPGEEEDYSNIYVYSPGDDRFEEYENTGYYSVVSYRYRANNPNIKENLPWTATFAGSDSYRTDNTSGIFEGRYLTASEWISDKDENNKLFPVEGYKNKAEFRGEGSDVEEIRMLDFYPHYLVTNWDGDKKMQNTDPFTGNSEDNPYDLSTFGGMESRSTANCYIVDRPGWYCLPLVYGNALVKGNTNSNGFRSAASGGNILGTFTDYNGNDIADAYITVTERHSATLVWQDTYNMVSNVSLSDVKGERMLKFYVEQHNLQQGNAIVGLQDEQGIIMWSWHIWATEHWLGSDGKPQLLSSDVFSSTTNAVTEIRERGDAKVTENMQGHEFYMSPYNLGWCDPKSVMYLRRKSSMDFVQYMPDKVTKTKLTGSLDIIQQGEVVDHKIGNNTYYQWGRKDPLVGFVDRNKNFKANFGPKELDFELKPQTGIKIKDGICQPNVMFAGNGTGAAEDPNQNWTIDRYMNLWNNSSSIGMGTNGNFSAGDLWSHVKTVYDPCPVGYVVPNAGIWNVLGYRDPINEGKTLSEDEFDNGPKSKINGKRGRLLDAKPTGIWIYYIYGTGNDKDVDNYIYLVPTGNRWYSDTHSFTQQDYENGQELKVVAGLNYNLRMFYAWTNRLNSQYSGLTGAIGIDGASNGSNNQPAYVLTPQFDGRCAMGRPVRPIRDPNFTK